jgi:hypothetical protein
MSEKQADLAGRRVLVVGGETPAGRALAVGLAEGGCEVALATLTNTQASDFAVNSALNELWAMSRKGLALVIDASDGEQLRRAVARAEGDLGRLDAAAVLREEGVALEALRSALGGRPVVVLAEDVSRSEAVAAVAAALG